MSARIRYKYCLKDPINHPEGEEQGYLIWERVVCGILFNYFWIDTILVDGYYF